MVNSQLLQLQFETVVVEFVYMFLPREPNGICISQVQAVLYLLIRHSYSTYKGIIHTIFALQLLILSNCKL